ncbi:MAG: sensor histidine kinase [Deltaproteobacteria bacterium]|nr:sensor histidine kinase [Deltaproteobacteria bacterium]
MAQPVPPSNLPGSAPSPAGFALTEENEIGGESWRDSLGSILLVLVLTTFVVEFGIMAVLYSRGRPTTWVEVVLDPTLNILFLSPALFFFVIQPFRRKAARQRETERVLRTSREQFRRLSARLEAVREEERRRISREVHDELGQALTALKLDLGFLLRRAEDGGGSAVEKLCSMSALVDGTIAAVQRICRELRPGLLDDLGPAAAFEWQAREFEERTGIACELSIEPKEIACDSAAGTALFRVLQEALTNVARHAQADLVEVTLREAGPWVTMTVRDNGRGITRAQVAASTSLGLLGIRERAAQLGGVAMVDGAEGEGTTVTLNVPRTSMPAIAGGVDEEEATDVDSNPAR